MLFRSSPDHRVLLALNGEIYNSFDYKPELKKWGYNFRSTTDTEVVLALYMRYGFQGMLNRLNGMFAIVVIDLRKQELYITRDRFGIKPMYYVFNNKYLAFASELKSFKFLNYFRYRLDESRMDEFLLYRSNLNGTLFKDIDTLVPGSYISYSLRNGFSIQKYFDINIYSRRNESEGDLSFYGGCLEDWLSKSVKSQLMSDVKLGCQLSGGIDSSIVTWLANRNSEKGKFEAVSIIFDNERFSEENFINTVTRGLEIPSHRFQLDSDYYLDHIEETAWHLEVPLNHPNTIAIYKLSQMAKRYVTVLLSGEGADEVFGGYNRFYNIHYPFRIRKILHEAKSNRRDPDSFFDYFAGDYRAIMETAFMSPYLAKKLWHGFNKKRAINERIKLYNVLEGSLFDRQVKYEMQTYLPDLLIRQDKMSMAHSIENRVPFLDNDVVENSFSIPEKFLLLKSSPEGYNTEKYLMKKMAAKEFGNAFAFRNKMGFGIPVKSFFLNKRFNEYLKEKVVPGIRTRGLFEYDTVQDWLTNLNILKNYEIEALWVMLSFEIWASIFIDDSHENWNSSY